MPGFVSIRAAILTKLTTLTGGGQKLAFVYDRHTPDIEGYPAVTFDVSDSDNDFLSNRDNLRAISFQLVIYQSLKSQGLDAATNLLDAAADDIVTAIENDPTLSSAVDWCEPLAGPRLRFQTPQGDVIAQVLTIKCNYSSALTF